MKNLNKHIFNIFLIIRFFLATKGKNYFWGCLSLAISRLLQTVAFFLPIKVLIMLSSENMPSYLGPVEAFVSYDEFLIFLIIMVPLVYFAHLGFGILFRSLIDKDILYFEKNKHGIKGYGEVDYNKLKRLHNHTSKAFSDVLVFFVTSTILIVINPLLTLSIWLVTALNLAFFVERAFYIHDDERITFLKLHKRQFIEYVASSNYLIVFIVLVAQMYLSSDGVYGAILALLLARQLFQAVQRFSIENIYLSKFI
ncbi:hypothetical protein [Larsenimonas suaedae]|uniref:EI24 domain-containing protein n=1 Tax=Larsenimonas suaedae TaxID=1851019 RepID=A0ABU1GWJ4_9GAMM|nr:hypothetical protein [Larsenimonas suaedae]MCM2972983.1 hypothetical protein [Larsenimonas suaedae]MDR5896420.1 hypothetical protein [Larsenimonas suaedae]